MPIYSYCFSRKLQIWIGCFLIVFQFKIFLWSFFVIHELFQIFEFSLQMFTISSCILGINFLFNSNLDRECSMYDMNHFNLIEPILWPRI